jgi:low temperature requirement protein LtrA
MMEETVRKATWLELFYDLVFVVAIARAVHGLGHTHDGHIAARFFLDYFVTMVVLWWAWTGHTLFANRFDTDDWLQRMLTLGQMGCVLATALFTDGSFDRSFRGFVISYAAFRLLLVVMYLRAAVIIRPSSSVACFLGAGFTAGLLVSLSSIFFSGLWRPAILCAGVAVDVLVPLLLRRLLKRNPVQGHHLPERYGLLTIILLGESVASLVSSLDRVDLSSNVVVAVSAGFVWIAAVWWTYYDNLEHRIYGRELGTGQAIIFIHLALYVGLGGIANSIRFAIEPGLGYAQHRWLTAGSVVLFFVALQLLHAIYLPPGRRARLLTGGAIAIVLLIGAAAVSPTALILLCAVAFVFVAYALADAMRRRGGRLAAAE